MTNKLQRIEHQHWLATDWLGCAKHYERIATNYALIGDPKNSKAFEESSVKYRLVACMYALGWLLDTLSVVENGEFKNTVDKKKEEDE